MTPPKYLSRAVGAFELGGPLKADPTARMLNAMLWILTLWFGIWGIILLPYHSKDWFWSMQNQIVTDGALVTALVLLRRGRFRAATYTYLGSMGFFATHVMALSGGIRSPVQALYVTLPISAAWLLGYGAAVWVSGACMGVTLLFAGLELAGVPFPRRIPGTPLGVWAVFGMACLIGAIPVAQILRNLLQALTRSHEAEEAARSTTERLRIEIEEHRRTEQALRESEERFRVTADTAPVMIAAGDADRNATFFNKVWLNFRSRSMEQEVGTGWTEGVHPDDLKGYLQGVELAYSQRKEYHLQFRLRRADGEYRLMLCHGVPRFEVDKTFGGYICSCVDITELNRGQEEALARQKLESLGLLASGIAHDFNNLLGSISAQSEVLMEDMSDPACRDGLSRIEAVAARGSEIVRQLMVYAGQESATLAQVDVAAVVREMLPLMSVSISKNAKVEVDLPDGLPRIPANVAQIRQVLLNLVTNASEALGGKEGVIGVALGQREGAGSPWLRLEVRDTGCGMSEQLRAAIFDPFFTTKGAGRGLGLAAVQGIVRGHGGRISVMSTPGCGSRFEVLLPCGGAPGEVPGDGEPASVPDGDERLEGTVLMVEDEPTLRGAVTRLLRGTGLRVLETGDGRTAVELFRTHQPEIDVVLLDVTLAGLPGREVLQKMREMRPSVRVVITSAYGRDRALMTVNGEPSQPFVRKPYRVKELLDVIRSECACARRARPAQCASSR